MVDVLRQRSELLRAARQFFHERDFAEVETPLLAAEVIPELHIEPLETRDGFLQASPELHMKRLVAAGMSAIFQLTRSFRGGERGPLHAPEFTLLEWYRVGDDLQAGMRLLDEFCQSVLRTAVAVRTSYAAAFEEYVGIDPHRATVEELRGRAAALRAVVPRGMDDADRDEWLNFLLALVVEPRLGRTAPEILYDYPASQAALAKTVSRDGVEVAERFELYWRGVELANGYHELTDASELRRRLEAVNRERESLGRRVLPLPESLLTAMAVGLPSCAGCALGFDRLVMLALGKASIAEVRAPGAE